MAYLVSQILLCLAIAFALGLVVSWLLSRRAAAAAQAGLAQTRAELARTEAALSNLEGSISTPRPASGEAPLALDSGAPAWAAPVVAPAAEGAVRTPDPEPTEATRPDPDLPEPEALATAPPPSLPEARSAETPRPVGERPVGERPVDAPRAPVTFEPMPMDEVPLAPSPQLSPLAATFLDDAPELSGAALSAPEPAASDPARPEGAPEPPAYDDLTRISGIGPRVEEQLAAMGVATYRQIARLADDDIARVGRHLGVDPDRVRREAWVMQAAVLHREVYGTTP